MDPPPAPVGVSGWAPAPVPRGDVAPPRGDQTPQPGFAFGVPTPPLYTQGETFRGTDPSAESQRPQTSRYPSPGGTLRLPF